MGALVERAHSYEDRLKRQQAEAKAWVKTQPQREVKNGAETVLAEVFGDQARREVKIGHVWKARKGLFGALKGSVELSNARSGRAAGVTLHWRRIGPKSTAAVRHYFTRGRYYPWFMRISVAEAAKRIEDAS